MNRSAYVHQHTPVSFEDEHLISVVLMEGKSPLLLLQMLNRLLNSEQFTYTHHLTVIFISSRCGALRCGIISKQY